ncbi:NYN domain-containing protein [Methanocaldococcus sp. 28A]
MDKKLNILKIKANLIKYVDVDEIENLPKVKVKSVEEFLEAHRVLGKNVIYRYEDNLEQIFFFVDNGVIFYIPTHGFKSLSDFIEAKSLGLSAEEYYEYLEFGNLDEYKKYKTSGFRNIEDYKKAKELGFINGLKKLVEENIAKKVDDKYIIEYLNYGILEEQTFSNDAELYYFALEKGFKNFDELVKALKAGFGDINEYQDALKRGFKDAYEYNDALSKGFNDAEEYKIAKAVGVLSKKELEEYKELKRICENFGLETFEEGYLLKILMDMNIDETINLKDLYNKLKEKEKLMKIKKDMLNKIVNNSVPLWYSTRFITIDDLEEYLENSEIVSFLGEYIKEEKIFRRIYPPKPSRRIVIIDALSVLGNIHNLSSKSIENLIKKIKNAGFKYIIVVIDMETYYKIKGKDIWNYLVNECNIKRVKSKDEAYDFIIDYIKNFGALVISNTSFKDYIMKNPKYPPYKEIKDYIIPFTIEDGEINIDIELLRKLYTEMSLKRLEKIKETVIV